MTTTQQNPRAVLKRYARQVVFRRIFPCLAASGIFMLFQMAAIYFKLNAGGVLGYYLLRASEYSTATGIFTSVGGVTAILRLDSAGLILALPLSFRQICFFLASTLLVLVAAAPLFMGVLEHYAALLQDRARPWVEIFRWYQDLRLSAKAVLMQLLLSAVKWVSRLVLLAPGVFLLVYGAGGAQRSDSLALLGAALLLPGLLLGYWVYCQVLPAQYLLALEPDVSLGLLIRRGLALGRGRRRSYMVLRLSFFLWHLLSTFTYGALGILVQPYFELSNLLFLRPPAAAEVPVVPPSE